jgi:hypothetical protein
MNKKETKIHETLDSNLTDLLDKIDLCMWHMQQSNEDYKNHLYDLQQIKRGIKIILNADFDKLARSRKQN